MVNGTIFQYFEWNLPADGKLWRELARDAEHLAEIGVSAVWIPPAYKGSGADDVGYGVYDLYDFGAFDQKGTVATKYGTRAELETAIAALHKVGIEVILDTVLNHRMNGDAPEKFMAQPVAADNRLKDIGKPREIEAFTAFTFPGRRGKYSPFEWHWQHFSGVDFDNLTGDTSIFRILGEGKGWSQGVDKENGNYDFLMGNDVDVNNKEVVEQLLSWGRWAIDTFGFDGFRMDAVKHIDRPFTKLFIEEMRRHAGKRLYAVGEYWSEERDTLTGFIDDTEGVADLFDIPLHFNFSRAAEEGDEFDMSTILDGSLVQSDDIHAVTFVDNHDTQPRSSLASPVRDWFKPLAYALILLMKEGYPVIFYGDYYSIGLPGDSTGRRLASPHRDILDTLLRARREHAYGEETLILDHPSTIALVRHGDADHSGLVLVMSNGDAGEKEIDLGRANAGRVWHEITGAEKSSVVLDSAGRASFPVGPRSMTLWTMD